MSVTSSLQTQRDGEARQARDGRETVAAVGVGVVAVEALSRKATCLLFIHLESDAHKVNPCVRHWARHNTHTPLLTSTHFQQARRRRTTVQDRRKGS